MTFEKTGLHLTRAREKRNQLTASASAPLPDRNAGGGGVIGEAGGCPNLTGPGLKVVG